MNWRPPRIKSKLLPSGYLTVRHGKIHPFFIGKPSTYFYGLSIPWRSVSHHQRVTCNGSPPKVLHNMMIQIQLKHDSSPPDWWFIKRRVVSSCCLWSQRQAWRCLEQRLQIIDSSSNFNMDLYIFVTICHRTTKIMHHLPPLNPSPKTVVICCPFPIATLIAARSWETSASA